MSRIAKISGVCTLAFASVTGIWWLASPRITDRYVALKVVNGEVVDSDVESGKKMDAIWPNLDYVKLPGWIQEVTVTAEKGGSVSIRTKEKSEVYGLFKIQYELDKKDSKIGNVYSELKIDDEEDMKTLGEKISSYVGPAANNVYSKLDAMSINDDLIGVGRKIKEELQKMLDEEGYTYVRIRTVLPNGVGLSDKANNDMEQTLTEQRKQTLLDAQAKTAEKSVNITEKQTEVTLRAIQKLKQEGNLTSQEAIQAYYLTLLRVEDKIGTPNVPGPIPGTGVGAYTPK